MINYRWTCIETGEVVEVRRSIGDRDVPPSEDELTDLGSSVLVKNLERRPEAPVISKRHIPATGRSRLTADGDFRDLREADKLEEESFNMGLHDRETIGVEIDKLRGVED